MSKEAKMAFLDRAPSKHKGFKMKKKFLLLACLFAFSTQNVLQAHCQMPCGIFDDTLVFKYIDQYIETMQKAVVELNDIGNSTAKDRAQFTRWVMLKEKESDLTANLITTYFLQQAITPGKEGSDEKTLAAHRLLFLLVKIKQNTDATYVNKFINEWSAFKPMFKKRIEEQRVKAEEKKSSSREHKTLKGS